ncbi:hypothetical protein [Clostridium butyricum]|uniref:hypothetical protein n=1 Tax=Clostridium butyricum TaxID=1492 RepID=UPI00325AE734
MAKSAINLTGKKLNLSGVLNSDDMTLEVEEFTEPLSLKSAIDKVGLDSKFVKISIQETDAEFNESDFEK